MVILGNYYMKQMIRSRECSYLLTIGGFRIINLGKCHFCSKDRRQIVSISNVNHYREIHKNINNSLGFSYTFKNVCVGGGNIIFFFNYNVHTCSAKQVFSR